MSESENAPKRPKPRNAVRNAWRWLAAYVLVEISVQILFEWLNAVTRSTNGNEYPFFDGVVLWFFLGSGAILFIRSLLKREKAAALIYAAMIALCANWPRITTPADLTAKAYFFSTFPDKCPEGRPKPGYRVFLCYTYWESYGRSALVFNPGDELAKPYTSWPPEFDKEIFENAQNGVSECRKMDTRRLVNHIYAVEDKCWGNIE